MGMARSHAGDGDPSKNRQGDPRRRRGSVDRVTVANCPLLPAVSAPGDLRAPPLPASGERFGDCGAAQPETQYRWLMGSSSAGNSVITRQPLSVTTTSSSMRAAE